MIKYRKPIKLLAINCLVILTLLITPGLILIAVEILNNNPKALRSSASGKYPGIVGNMPPLRFDYVSYVGWKPLPVRSEVLNIDPVFRSRYTNNKPVDIGSQKIWFFGGSTIFGHLVSDSSTIPSYYQQFSGDESANFGQSGWSSRQSLNEFITLISSSNFPRKIVFYDGVNDVMHPCRTEHSIVPSHGRASYLIFTHGRHNQAKITYEFLFEYIFLRPYKQFAQQFNSFLNSAYIPYDCHINSQKAQAIVDNWYQNWLTAYILAKSVGSEAIFILQPTLYSTSSSLAQLIEHPEYSETARLQIVFLYDLFKSTVKTNCSVASAFCKSIHFGDKWLLGHDHVFIDDHHITPEGNERISQKIYSILSE
ncbi:hypothetical protein SynMINOS11_00053 [Synechococcus sp. Minos11]|uniref:hypothetical protein n=1 Tax=Synechococcus sp. Minos11 TaxID=221341 RepID=UPI00164546D5|nr:hypothetical protein [Synechococcus sp. Minos11]QNJ07542.1 hypothetical protein SynMINOS11_00053 [Synechococcus sp. Minos11]